MIIKSTAELSIDELNRLISDWSVSEIKIKDKENYPRGKTYDVWTLYSIKQKIIKFLKNCPQRDPNNPHTELEIFSYIYTKLGLMVEYDELARDINNSNPNFRGYACDLLDSASGLEGALIGKVALCSGFAETLRNLLAEMGIEAKYVEGWSRKNKGELEKGHAWNQVKLYGVWFNCDITNDREFIIDGLALPSFLKANYEFRCYQRYPADISPKVDYASYSIARDYQQFLISYYRDEILRELSEAENIKECSKPNFIRSIFEKLKIRRISQRGEE